MILTHLPRTARELLGCVQQYGPGVDGGDLVLVTDPPSELEGVLRMLHTGVRALLTGRCWWGSTTGKPRVIELNPAELIPADIELLAVDGDSRWDRLPADACLDFPNLFVLAAPKNR